MKEITPKTGGIIYLWFSFGDDYTMFWVKVEGGPDEGYFRSAITLDRASAMPGETLTANVSLSGGRWPMGQTRIGWRVRDASGELREIHQETGLTSTITVPQGIQGVVEAETMDSAERVTLGRQAFGIGMGEPLRVSMQLDKASVAAQQPITAHWAITGGEAPYTAEARWELTAGSDGLGMYGDVQEGPLFSTFSPWEGGYASVSVTVRDAKGREVETDKMTFIVTDKDGNKVQPRFNTQSTVPPAIAQAVAGAVPPRSHTPASLNQRMATRSGPGTKYTEELGTHPQDTAITLIETVTTYGTPWGLVEFYRNGLKYRAYTGMKRIDAYGPVAQGTLDYYETVLSQATAVYYGPGFDYAQRKGTVPAGTLLQVYGEENGFALCDYESDGKWVRAYFPAI